MPVVGYNSNDVINYKPEEFYITEERLLKRACSCKSCIRTALAPKRVLPRVLISDDLLAQIVIAKCLDRQPIYHIEKRWASRHEMMIPRDNMARWTNQLATQLQPIYNLIQEEFSEYDIGSLDATWLQVLKEDGREPQVKSKAWCFVGGRPEKPVVLFEYCADEHVGFLMGKLQDFKGYMHGDADNAYTSFHKHDIHMVYCNAHSRRHYVPIAESVKSEGIASHILKEYQKLYKIEEEIKNLTPNEKKVRRQKEAKPILDEMYTYLVNRYDKVPPKSHLKEAMGYTIQFWKGLTRYLDDGRLSIDNNHTERTIRQFVMARNNFLFADTVKGAKALCLHFSLIQTANENGIEPYQYYQMLLNKIPHCQTVEDYEALLPWNINQRSMLHNVS
jgi:transposase